MSNPNITHFKALDRIWKYLNKYPTLGTYYNCNISNLELLGYTDADWGGDIISRKSTSGFLFLLNNNIISWLSMLQKTVALSSCESEYMAFKEAIKEVIYLNNLRIYFNKFLNNNNNNNNIPKLLTDSESAMKLANNPEFHKRSKHIDITYHFIRDAIIDKKVDLLYINTKRQLADGFTKGLDINKHNNFISSLGLR
jgi:ABC-type transport system involved in Fe-S cluster assembly fused permease/ATPase subunit